MVFRQPFPGPGLGVRIIGEVTAQKVKIVQDADAIYREEIANAGLDRTIGQYFAALTNMRSVGVMGDERTYDHAIALRAVNTIDFMTAEAAQIPYKGVSNMDLCQPSKPLANHSPTNKPLDSKNNRTQTTVINLLSKDLSKVRKPA